MRISAVVLAAGASTRMGRQKLLLPMGDVPLLRRTVAQVAGAGFDDLLVVLGFEHEATAAVLAGLPCRTVVNPDYATGMGSSFRTAVGALDDSQAAMFALADQPFVTSSDYRRLLDAYRANPRGIVSVRYGDVTAPPHLFDRAFFPELAALQHGARSVLQRHAGETTVLPFPEDRLVDIDTPEDYERASARLSSDR
ncbi:MAG: nucleotidyltransferase family protein [Vicinamibacterales bacterium]